MANMGDREDPLNDVSRRRRSDERRGIDRSLIAGGLSTWITALALDISKENFQFNAVFVAVHVLQLVGVIVAVFGAKRSS